MLHSVEADHAALQRICYRGSNGVEGEGLEQPQDLDVFPLSLLAHPRFQQPTQIAKLGRQLPPDQGSRLIQRVGLLLQQGQIVQRIEDEVLPVIGTRVPRYHLSAATDDHLMHIAANQHLAMAEPCGDRVVGSPVADQRQRADPSRTLVAGIKGGCGKGLKNRAIPLQALADRLIITP